MIKSDPISSFFKKSGPQIGFLIKYVHFEEYDVKRKKENAPARNSKQPRQRLGKKKKKKKTSLRGIVHSHVRVWMKKNHPNIISNNPIQ